MPTSTYEKVLTYTAPSAQTSYTFSTIPSTYTDLVLVMSYSLSVGGSSTFMRFNGDTASNYSDTYLINSGSSAASSRDSSSSNGIRFAGVSSGTGAGAMRSTIASIQNYSNATTYKTVLSRDSQAADEVASVVGLWRGTPAAITSIYLWSGGGASFNTGATFTLYGIKAA
jgi:hypothetical protein